MPSANPRPTFSLFAYVIGASSFLLFSFSSGSHLQGQPPQGPGGPGGPNAPDVMLVEKFDADGDGVLNEEERVKARKEIKQLATQRGGRGGRGGRGDRADHVEEDEDVAAAEARVE